jgi:hypothetical protein
MDRRLPLMEEMSTDDMLEKITNFLDSSLAAVHSGFNYGGRETSILVDRYETPHGKGLWLGYFDKKEVKSVSLADPKLAYQNTSARRVTHKKKSFREVYYVDKYAQLEKKVKSIIDGWAGWLTPRQEFNANGITR